MENKNKADDFLQKFITENFTKEIDEKILNLDDHLTATYKKIKEMEESTQSALQVFQDDFRQFVKKDHSLIKEGFENESKELTLLLKNIETQYEENSKYTKQIIDNYHDTLNKDLLEGRNRLKINLTEIKAEFDMMKNIISCKTEDNASEIIKLQQSMHAMENSLINQFRKNSTQSLAMSVFLFIIAIIFFYIIINFK